MASNFEIMQMMADEDMDIRAFPDLVNVKSAKGGGHVTMGTDIGTAQQLMKSSVLGNGEYVPILYRDPNDFVRHKVLFLLFTDQAEYYAVCTECKSTYHSMQWSGSTQVRNWRERAERYLDSHQTEKGWCEFCDPVFGNGGWSF